MSKLSQYISFINADKMPTAMEMVFNYTHISKTEELKQARKDYKTNKGKKLL